MPASLELQREYGDALQVLFVECQGADLDKAEAFAWRQKWMDTRAMWTDERPLSPSGNGLPAFALLDVDGNVLLEGNPLSMKKQIEEAIAAQAKKTGEPPAGTPVALAKAWKRFAKGEVAAALAECDALASGDELGEAANALRVEMVARTEARLARAQWLLANGYVSEGLDLLAGLAKAVEGDPDLGPRVADELARLKGAASLAAEAEASKALAAIQRKMEKGKAFDDGNVKALQKLAEKHAGTKAAERAARLAKLAAIEFR